MTRFAQCEDDTLCSTKPVKPMRILIVFGTRPEIVKLAPLIRTMRADRSAFQCRICHTGQHREMSRNMLAFFDLDPDIDLDLMTAEQTSIDIASAVTKQIGAILIAEHTDLVLVQGDTTTAFAAALAAFYSGVPIAHVEAGLRTDNPFSPYPEEMNRRLISRMATLHFAPTERAANALQKENIPASNIYMTGNTGIDSMLTIRERISSGALPRPDWLSDIASGEPLVLITMHRRENFDMGVKEVCSAITKFVQDQPTARFIFPVHPNPAIREPVRAMLSDTPGVLLTGPLSYTDLIAAMDEADILLTDSGGIQEEGSALGKPIIVMRETTERPEVLTNGNAVLTGADAQGIYRKLMALSVDRALRKRMSRPCSAFGDGQASKRIADALKTCRLL